MNNSSGKVLTIFLVIIAILLISLTAISLFFFQKETDRRKLAETTLEEYRAEKTTLEESLKETKKQNFLLQEKNKEADARLNDLSDELELEKGLREEMKIETAALKKKIDEAEAFKKEITGEIEKKEELQDKLMAELAASGEKIKELEAKLKAEAERGQKLGRLYDEQQKEMMRMEDARASVEEVKEPLTAISNDIKENNSGSGIELGEIIVVPGEDIDSEEDILETGSSFTEMADIFNTAPEGRVLSVDAETEFVIVSIGEADGVEVGSVLSVYRGDDYIGDIRVTRLQPEMSAADLIPPFSIRGVKKNDQVKVK